MSAHTYPTRRNSGFTLLELMIVTAVLASIAGSAILMVGQTEESVQGKLAITEACTVREALIQFKKDTGYLPKQGPFALVNDGGSVPIPEEGADWFSSPANFIQLIENPLAGTTHPLATWNPDTKRGWRGPYLSTSSEGRVDIGSALNTDGTGSPTLGTIIDDVMAIADPYLATPDGNYYTWTTPFSGDEMKRMGRPYLFFDADDTAKARIVGMGPNRRYDLGIGDDVVFYLFR